jgi:hypothetical protein
LTPVKQQSPGGPARVELDVEGVWDMVGLLTFTVVTI